MQAINTAVQEAQDEGFPQDVEEKEAFFMQEVARGEGLSSEGRFQLLFKSFGPEISLLTIFPQGLITSKLHYVSTRPSRSTPNPLIL